MNPILAWVLARTQERSTWLGATALLSSLSAAISPELQSVIAQAGIAASGLVLVLTKEHGAKVHSVSTEPTTKA
jgi:hypothetical protein